MNVGFTYEIRDKSNPDLVYYGSSELSALEDRMKSHLQNFNNWKNTGAGYCSSYKVLDLNNYKASLLKIVFFTIKWELREQERHLIEYRVCVNELIPNRTKAEYYQDNKEKIKEHKAEWYQENKEKIKEQTAEYYQDNKEKIKERNADYYQANREKIKEYRAENKEKIKEKNAVYWEANKEHIKEKKKEYRAENKEKISKKFNCPCGGKYTHNQKSRHLKTKQHQNWLKTQE